jgi:hypothetical protein
MAMSDHNNMQSSLKARDIARQKYAGKFVVLLGEEYVCVCVCVCVCVNEWESVEALVVLLSFNCAAVSTQFAHVHDDRQLAEFIGICWA